MSRVDRLRKLLDVQEKMKALHETRHATHLAAAAAAEREAAEIAARFDAPDSLSALFPEVYNKRITDALTRKDESLRLAREEAAHLATATARTNRIEGHFQVARRGEDRIRDDRERLDNIQTLLAGKAGGKPK